MPKRIGYLYEKMISLENCIQAEIQMAKNKRDNPNAVRIGKDPEKYGRLLYEKLSTDSWEPMKSREFDIVDNYKGKTRHLKVPALFDQAAQYAWLNIATPYIERRNYYYNCGSIPGAGQMRAVRALQKWLGVKKNKPKYGAVSDIRHFYETCPHWVVMDGLRAIFKDEKFLAFADKIMKSMSETGVGLAIGHPSSHWLANVALMKLDKELQSRFPDVKFVRYMDDISMVSNNKRHIKKAMELLREEVAKRGMEIKPNWQIFRIKDRGISFLSYRFFHKYTVLTKPLMYRISKRTKRIHRPFRPTVEEAQMVMSYNGILSHCDSHHFVEDRITPYLSINKCRSVISHAARTAKGNVC